MRTGFLIFALICVVAISALALLVSSGFWWLFAFFGPVILLGLYDAFFSKSAIVRNFPIVGRTRFAAEWLRPKLYQYFVEPDTDGRPFPRTKRNIVYQRAKRAKDTTPFGTQLNVYDEGYEWMNHSITPTDSHSIEEPRVLIGGKHCTKPYNASVFNVAAMSFGSLSSNAVRALNGGAAKGNFAHNTGEGGISPYHTEHGGDLIYQIGTGYFGARASDGNFDPVVFKETVAKAGTVKMIEIKLSQGAKPGHGGILPAKKVTAEIAKIRGIEMGKDVLSPPYHKAFSTPVGLLEFVQQCRELAGGIPVGFKLCVGHKSEFLAICKAMVATGITPDFITVDGGEGGTGAAPLEFSNSVGTPYKEGLSFVYNALVGFNLKKEIKIIASGKIVSGFDIFKSIALGADVCYSARAMMMAVGCIQALECNHNTCPTGVATQKPHLVAGLNVADKKERVYNYQKETIHAFIELLSAAGLNHPDKINRSHIYQRIDQHISKSYLKLYPYIPESSLLSAEAIPRGWNEYMAIADSTSFAPKFETVYIQED